MVMEYFLTISESLGLILGNADFIYLNTYIHIDSKSYCNEILKARHYGACMPLIPAGQPELHWILSQEEIRFWNNSTDSIHSISISYILDFPQF